MSAIGKEQDPGAFYIFCNAITHIDLLVHMTIHQHIESLLYLIYPTYSSNIHSLLSE